MKEPFYRPYDEISVGDRAELSVTLTEAQVNEFSALIGDADSFHVSDEAAARHTFETWRRCTRIFSRRLAEGCPLEKLAVAG